MNWTASLLREQLRKERNLLSSQRLAHQERINLLTNASIDVQNFLDLEEKIAVLEANLKDSEQKLTRLKEETENQANLATEQLKAKESQIAKLAKKITASKDLIFKLNQQIRENQLYYQREIKRLKEDYQTKLTPFRQEIKNLKDQVKISQTELFQGLASKQIELTEANQAIINLEETHTQSLAIIQQEITQTKQELAFTTGKITSCEKIFVSQIIKIIKKNIILWKSKELKQSLLQIKELMGWEGLVLPTDTASATPAETTE